MKYRVTEKHRLLRDDVIIQENNNKLVSARDWCHEFSEQEIKDWIEIGWIEEIQEPEYTRNDILEFLEHIFNSNNQHCEIEAGKFVDEWINKYKNEK